MSTIPEQAPSGKLFEDRDPFHRGGPAFAPGSAPSRAAARRVRERRAGLLEQIVEAVRAAGGLTDEEISARTGIAPNSARPRRLEAVRRGLLRDSGRARNTSTGAAATVWEVCG